ncbi:alpha/beta-hydrolase [Lophiostoma macrostomum CBS 122681]|uniref:Alpha/beta-hydrolase n=1 Tax=Lophiostoma macrostomum CBS 122681 TaxID=1314788 RepID=A0A6A6STU7_9PLEO|nr:alpha/beta-hydrolase [Lophiostoma macrostomum CBS 122681]
MSSPAPEFPGLLGLGALFLRCAPVALFRALTYPFRNRRAATFHKDVGFAVLRTALHTITIPQTRWLSPTTAQQYLAFCKDHAIESHSIHVDVYGGTEGAETDSSHQVLGHWIGDEDADVVVLYLHGGGYTQTATRGYFEFWHRFACENNVNGKRQSVATLLLGYSMAPERRYPTQIQEATAALTHLINTGRSPSTIIMSGDSAGGGLSLSVLSHLLHPHPDLPSVKLSTPLAGALLISPWVVFSTEYDSFIRNGESDMVEASMLRRWAAMYLGKSKQDPESDPGPVTGDSYSEPCSNDTAWWRGMDGIVSDVFFWYGGDEMLRDGIHDSVPTFKSGWTEGGGEAERVLAVETPRGCHIEPIMSVMTRPNERGEHQVVIEEWLRKRLEK